MNRIVSLLPAATEIVAALGAADRLVGVSHECDHPASVVGTPVLTRARVNATTPSAEIDRSVRALVESALSIYELDAERLAALEPDVIVTQDLCAVCAIPLAEVERAVARLVGNDVVIVSLSPTRLGDVLGDVARIADAIGRADAGRALRSSLERRLDAVGERVAGADHRPSVLSIEWLDPLMVGGTWMPELIEIGGGRALATRAGDLAPTLDAAALAALDPECVLVKPCGFSLERTVAEWPEHARALPWTDWPSCQSVWLADGNAYFNRPGPRIVESAQIVAACLHPDRCGDWRDRHPFERRDPGA